MIDVLLNALVPIFAVMALGYVTRWNSLASIVALPVTLVLTAKW